MLAEAWAERDAGRDAGRAEKTRLAARNDRLRPLIRQLQRLRFGRRSEKLDPDQLTLGLEDVEQAIAKTEAPREKTDPALKRARAEQRRSGRGSLPGHLPRVAVVIEPGNAARRSPRPSAMASINRTGCCAGPTTPASRPTPIPSSAPGARLL
jgi:hypothetical protein